jgi:hypothetical protein
MWISEILPRVIARLLHGNSDLLVEHFPDGESERVSDGLLDARTAPLASHDARDLGMADFQGSSDLRHRDSLADQRDLAIDRGHSHG